MNGLIFEIANLTQAKYHNLKLPWSRG